MKVAFVFSGMLREIDRRSESILKKVHELNADVYGSFWDIENSEYNSTIDNFIKTYNPKKIEIESYDDWVSANWETLMEEYNPSTDLNTDCYDAAAKANFFPMWYKIWRANMLTKAEKYDVIIRMRTDIGLSDKFMVIKSEFINFPHGIVTIQGWPNAYGMHDIIAYGNPSIMDYYSSLFLYITRYLKEGVYCFPPENLLRHHLAQKNITIRFYGDSVYLRDGGNWCMNEPNLDDWLVESRVWDLPQDEAYNFYKKR
jgi:hypothetical protein